MPQVHELVVVGTFLLCRLYGLLLGRCFLLNAGDILLHLGALAGMVAGRLVTPVEVFGSQIKLCLDSQGVVLAMSDLFSCLARSFLTGLQLLTVLSPPVKRSQHICMGHLPKHSQKSEAWTRVAVRVWWSLQVILHDNCNAITRRYAKAGRLQDMPVNLLATHACIHKSTWAGPMLQ